MEYQQNKAKKKIICYKYWNAYGNCRHDKRCYYAYVVVDPFKFVHEENRAQEIKRLRGLYEGIPDAYT